MAKNSSPPIWPSLIWISLVVIAAAVIPLMSQQWIVPAIAGGLVGAFLILGRVQRHYWQIWRLSDQSGDISQKRQSVAVIFGGGLVVAAFAWNYLGPIYFRDLSAQDVLWITVALAGIGAMLAFWDVIWTTWRSLWSSWRK